LRLLSPALCYVREVANSPRNPVIDHSAPDELLASSLRMAVMRLSRRLRAERSDETLGLSQMSALASLMHGPLSPTALAQIERIQPPSMTRVISALETRGLISREEHEHDKRQSVIAITEEGRSIIEEDRVKRKVWLVEIIDMLSDEERHALREALPILERITNS
jgi:DNA-binding MarR family transcriptional regulator